MDCPQARRWCSRLLRAGSLAPLVLSVGCLPSLGLPAGPGNSPPAASKDVTAEKDLPKRTPQASTCVAFGDLQLKAALDGSRAPFQKEQALDMARKYYQQAVKTDAKCLPAYSGLAQTYQELGDYDRAILTYHKALKVFPKEPSLWYALGMCQARHKDWESALTNLAKATELDPENRTYGSTLAFSLARAGRLPESVACFKKYVGEAKAHYNVARMLHHLKRDDDSKQHLRKALEVDPNLEPAKELLARLETPAPVKTAGAEKDEELPNLLGEATKPAADRQ